MQPTRRQPVRCQCTSHRRALFGKGWGRSAARVKWVVEGWYNQGNFDSLARGVWEGFVNMGDEWFGYSFKGACP